MMDADDVAARVNALTSMIDAAADFAGLNLVASVTAIDLGDGTIDVSLHVDSERFSQRDVIDLLNAVANKVRRELAERN
jgi:hypothetical protein